MMGSYKTELEGYCGEMVNVTVWKNGFILECFKSIRRDTIWRKITIPYINEVDIWCLRCLMSRIPIETCVKQKEGTVLMFNLSIAKRNFQQDFGFTLGELEKLEIQIHNRISKYRESCPHEIRPLHAEYCINCSLNGCYPWNTNPLLLCCYMGGMHPALEISDKCMEDVTLQCASFTRVDEGSWVAHLSDLQRMAKHNEDMRLKAMQGKVFSSEPLPAEQVIPYKSDEEK